ncbi:Unknown protein sequence [Pseudomonas coronafaciens pv. oryzae]|nr:Unknown protein sequence [Pseudomonas coronafaciens pv. oryzae]RMS99915.1 hypothetical protein ALP55_03637 [Pseudomonas coronafaciens pv. oryzae]
MCGLKQALRLMCDALRSELHFHAERRDDLDNCTARSCDKRASDLQGTGSKRTAGRSLF